MAELAIVTAIDFAYTQRTQMVGFVNHIPADSWDQQIKSFHFDTATSGSPYALPSLLAFADPSKITFGSGFPWAPAATAQSFTAGLDAFPIGDAFCMKGLIVKTL